MKDSSRDILEFNDFNEASEFYKMMNANSQRKLHMSNPNLLKNSKKI